MSHFVATIGDASPHDAPPPEGPRGFRFAARAISLRGIATTADDEVAGHGDSIAIRMGPCIETETGCEGRFVRLRVANGSGALTIETDPLGMRPVYVRRDARGTTVTDSIARASSSLAAHALDPAGAASFIALGWPLGDRTLYSEWRALAPGTSVFDASGACVTSVASIGSIGSPVRRPVEDAARWALAALRGCVERRFAQRPDTIVRLTGGQDSRLVLAVCRAAGLDPECVTRGAKDDPEVLHAREVASAARCRHRVDSEEAGAIAADWRRHMRTLFERTDGLVGAWQLADVAERDGAGASMLGGIGGEIARRFWNQPRTLDRSLTAQQAVDALAERLLRKSAALLSEDARRALEDALRCRLGELVEPLADPRDLPDVFYAWERVRRWGGANARKIDPASSTLPILASRAWLDAALSIEPEERAASALHPAIVRLACRRLLVPPLLNAEWRLGALERFGRWRRSRAIDRTRPATSTAIAETRRRLRATMLAALRDPILADTRSPLFDVVDRAAFERSTATPADDANAQSVMAVLTVWMALRGVPA